jgi:hypothetical protein
MRNDFRLRVGTGSCGFGRTSAACGILTATAQCMRYLGVDIFNFNTQIFLFSSGLILFVDRLHRQACNTTEVAFGGSLGC